jgi:hypothetical protein
MPSIDKSFLQSLSADYTQYPVFIETGTYQGDTIFGVEHLFQKLYTVEFSEKYYNGAKSKYNGQKITFLHGDSGIVFGTLLPTITDRCIFFLDGHWSASDTGKSAKDCPLVEELQHIYTSLKNEAIVIIDDCRLFGTSKATGHNEDWSNINEETLIAAVGDRFDKCYYKDSTSAKNDRLIIHIRAQ